MAGSANPFTGCSIAKYPPSKNTMACVKMLEAARMSGVPNVHAVFGSAVKAPTTKTTVNITQQAKPNTISCMGCD
jgi:hypothetical protein